MKFDQSIWSIPTESGLTNWGHPNGFTIVRRESDWGYEIVRRFDKDRKVLASFAKLSDAREWCDGRFIEAVTGKITLLAGPALREP